MKTAKRAVATAIGALALTLISANVAAAEDPDPGPDMDEIMADGIVSISELDLMVEGASTLNDRDTMMQAIREFEDSTFPRTIISSTDGDLIRYTLPEGVTITMPTERTATAMSRLDPPREVESMPEGAGGPLFDQASYDPDVLFRYGGFFNFAIGFTRGEQEALRSAVATTAIITAICTVTGGAGCVFGGIAVGMASYYVNWGGICPDGQPLWVVRSFFSHGIECAHEPF